LRISPIYFWIPLVTGIAGCGLLGYIFGVRDMALVVFIALLSLPITVFVGTIMRVTFNPKITVYQPDDLNLTGKI
jgi:hypothetical protein